MVTDRVLVTGSRGYTDQLLVRSTIEQLARQAKTRGIRLVVVHGGCPTGADHFASLAVQSLIRQGYDLVEEVHQAAWDKEGASAGPKRNSKMVALGAVLCLAFWDGVSKGTLDTMSKALRARIPVLLPTAELPILLPSRSG